MASGDFEITTVDGVVYRKGETAPMAKDVAPAVESYRGNGDWIDIRLSDGYTLTLPESRIAHILTHTN